MSVLFLGFYEGNHIMQQRITEVRVESVGTVKVSTIGMPDATRGFYWETAIMWPEGWAGDGFSADDATLDIIGCDRTQEDADETHQHWCNSEALARMAHAIVRLAMPTEKWHTTGWFGTWAERLVSEGR